MKNLKISITWINYKKSNKNSDINMEYDRQKRNKKSKKKDPK